MDDYLPMSPETIDAKRHSDVARLRQLVESGEDVRAIDYHEGGTLLHWAARHGHLEIMRALLDRGADIECRDEESDTPLMLAALAGHLDIVQLLLERGANPSDGTQSWDAASFAKLNDHAAIAALLTKVKRPPEPVRAAEKRHRTKLDRDKARDAAVARELFLARPENRKCDAPLVGAWQTLGNIWVYHADGSSTIVRHGGTVTAGPLWRATSEGELIQDSTNLGPSGTVARTRFRLSPDGKVLTVTNEYGKEVVLERMEPK